MIRVALTETRNAFAPMPASVDELEAALASRLADIRSANLRHNEALIRRAAARGARIVGLGELCTAPYFALAQQAFWRDLAEPAATGPSCKYFSAIARELGVVIVAPIYELDAASDRRYDTALVIDADGSLLGAFRKLHIPHGANETAAFSERFYYGPSDTNTLPVFDTSVGCRVGVAICYDRHFEGVVGGLARAGAQLVLVPAVTFGSQSRRMWALEAPVEACRHRVFVGSSNRKGKEAPWNVNYFGESYFCGPEGTVAPLVAAEGSGGGGGGVASDLDRCLVIADLDLASLHDADSSGWNLARDRRPLPADAQDGGGGGGQSAST